MKRHTVRERLLQGSRADIVRHLRQGPRSVNELAGVLGVTDNAVRAQLTKLSADGLVATVGQRPATRRPEQLYALTPEAEDLFPKAYDVLLEEFLDVLERRTDAAEVSEALEEVGNRIGTRFRKNGARTREERIRHALQVIEDLGGAAELNEADGCLAILGLSCPVAAVAKGRPAVCHMVEVLLSSATGLTIRAKCEQGNGHVRCTFDVA